MLEKLLKQGAEELGLELADEKIQQLREFIDLLIKWNRAYNLTAIIDEVDIVNKHLLDSLSIGEHISADDILDVGTGAGFPGIVLAIYHPEKHFTLLDSNNKRIRFLQQVAGQLGLENVTPIHARVEKYKPENCYACITSRAFSSLYDFVNQTQHLLCPDGKFFAMKGQYPEQELNQLPDGIQTESIIDLRIPGLDAKRHLVVLSA